MDERYERLFSLSTHPFAESAPVKIEAAALSRDHTLKKNVIQVKFQNCGQNDIERLSVKFVLMDQNQDVINQAFVFQYQALQAHPGDCFGDRVPVLVSDAVVSFDVELIQVRFSNGTEWPPQEGESAGETARTELTSALPNVQQPVDSSPVTRSTSQEAVSVEKKRPTMLILLVIVAACLLLALVFKNTLLSGGIMGQSIMGRWDAVAIYIDGETYPFPDNGYIEINRDHTVYLHFNEDTAWEGEWSEAEDTDIDSENIQATYYIDLDGLPRGLLCLHGADEQQVSVTLPVEIRNGAFGTVIFEKEQEL